MIIALALCFTLGACSEREEGEKPFVNRDGLTEAEPAGVAPKRGADSAVTDADPHGTLEAGAYKNGYFGIACDFDGEWELFSDAELAALAETDTAGYDMYAIGGGGLCSVSVTIEDIGAKEALFYDEEGYIDASLEAFADADDVGAFSRVETRKVRAAFAGGERFAAYSTGEYTLDEWKKAEVYQLSVCVKNGRYVALITFMSFFEDKTADLAAMWRET